MWRCCLFPSPCNSLLRPPGSLPLKVADTQCVQTSWSPGGTKPEKSRQLINSGELMAIRPDRLLGTIARALSALWPLEQPSNAPWAEERPLSSAWKLACWALEGNGVATEPVCVSVDFSRMQRKAKVVQPPAPFWDYELIHQVSVESLLPMSGLGACVTDGQLQSWR